MFERQLVPQPARCLGTIARWREEYNGERPHSSLGYGKPNEFGETLHSSVLHAFYMDERIEAGQMRFRVPRKPRRLTLEKPVSEATHGGSRIISPVDEAHLKAYIRVRQKDSH
jgi:Integrase core domain